MNIITNQEINGKFLYYAFVAGSQQLLIHQEEINRINVFPVRDKDIGTNLASTIRAVIDTTRPDKSYKKTIGNIAEAALIGARGNSGIIFAQFLHGLNRVTKNKQKINFSEFAESVKKSIPFMYEAVANPIEGTMLTVIRDWSDFLSSKKESSSDFKKNILDSTEVLNKSLSETTSKLKDLKKYGFVDAGAKGFVVFIQGVINFIQNRNITPLAIEKMETISLLHSEEITDKQLTYRYCTEAILKNVQTNRHHIKPFLAKYGDSVVVAGSASTCRIHVHTNQPATLFDQLKEMGTITFQKVDDMQRQQDMAKKKKMEYCSSHRLNLRFSTGAD
ncbi:MAG: DAK2 domain-containing protein [Bacteroidaceae bacterium]